MSQIYDPLGLILPFTLVAKLLMRKICTFEKENSAKFEWDTELPTVLSEEWKQFFIQILI